MKSKTKNMKAENYNSDLLDSMLDVITPEQQKNIDRKMMLAAKIYDAMKAKGWNQKTFAEAMGKQQSEISKWLSGTHSFTIDTLWAIEDQLGTALLLVQDIPKIVEVKYLPIVVSAKAYEGVSDSFNVVNDRVWDESLSTIGTYDQLFLGMNISSLKSYNENAYCG